MKIAILSDSHEHFDNLKKVMKKIEEIGAEALLFCGDFCGSKPAQIVAAFKGPVFVVFGNHDGDPLRIVKYSTEINPQFKYFDEGNAILELGGRKIAMTHYPLYGNALARTGDYDLVCFGHDHDPRIETHGNCIAVNPGSILGDKKPASFAIYDTSTHKAELHAV